jgi:hypothetical protein
VILFYDARPDFVTYLSLANESLERLDVELLFLSGAAGAPHAMAVEIGPRSSRTLDVGALVGQGLPEEPGIALATAVDAEGRAMVSRALAGSFTVANRVLGSAWGAPGAGRLAVQPGSEALRPPLGSPIDGEAAVLERLAPAGFDLAVYFDPAALAAPTEGGNQLVFVSFDDPDGSGDPEPAATRWRVRATRNDGVELGGALHVAAGVEVTDLAAVVGPAANGAAGRLRLMVEGAGADNRLVFFAQALGSFSAGYLLPTIGAAEGGDG